MAQIAIIGAGPAGSLAALLLARAGRAVVLIEQHRFPRDKVCGECISALGVEVLERHGLLPRLLEAGGMWMDRFIIHSPAGASSAAALPRPMLGLSRTALDGLLLEAAREAGAEVMQPCRCEAIEPELRVRRLESNDVETVPAERVLLADGRGALLSDRPGATADLGIKAHFEGLSSPRDAVQVFGVGGFVWSTAFRLPVRSTAFRRPERHTPLPAKAGTTNCYGGIAPIEADRFNAAFSVPAEWLRALRSPDAVFERLLAGNAALASQFRPGRQMGPWLTSPLPRHAVQRSWPAGIIPIGNAAAAIEPIGGEGMGLALRSAELAVEMLLSGHNEYWLRQAYQRLWRTRAWSCRTTALCVSQPVLCAIAVEAIESWDSVREMALGWMGKGAGDVH